jgi:hypothetical protein
MNWLAPAARSAKTDACGRSFAVLPAQVSAAGLRLRHNRLTCASMLEVSWNSSSVVERSRVHVALSVQQLLTLAAIYLSRFGVVGSVFAAALT